mgnify:CR=1 FL=1
MIPVYSKRPFRIAEHLVRLQHSLDGIRLANPMSDAQWTQLMTDIIARNLAAAGDDQSVYLQITRGVAKRDHAFPKDVKQTVFVMSGPLTTPPLEQIEMGGAAISTNDFRWLKCDVKSVSLLGNCLAKQMAVDAGALETIMFRDGKLHVTDTVPPSPTSPASSPTRAVTTSTSPPACGAAPKAR